MGKTKEEHEKEIIKQIKSNNIHKIQHIFVHYLDLKSAQFYNLELEKSEGIKEAINLNKTKSVEYMIHKWIESENATLQISAFKVLCDEEDRKKLSMQFTESKNVNHEIDLSSLSTDEIKDLLKENE